MLRVDASFLEAFLIHPELLSWEPSSYAPDLVKKIIDVLQVIREDPASLRERSIKLLVFDKDSQIINKEAYFAHIFNTAQIYRQLVERILTINPALDLPEPNIARGRGLVHDLDCIFTKYQGNYRQQEKQLTLYFYARHMGLDYVANHVAMHCAYWEILEIIKEGGKNTGFADIRLYDGWRKVLNDPRHPLFFDSIKSSFELFLKGKDNLPLIVLNVADHLENGKPFVNFATLEGDFESRMRDIINRYYTSKVLSGETPPPLGYALVKKGGLERSVLYKQIVKYLLSRNISNYREIPGFMRVTLF